MTRKILLSWSSGKDSAWALHVLRRDGFGEVAGLLTSVNQTAGRVSMHGVREEILRAQASAAGLPVQIIRLPWPCTNEIYESRLGLAVARAVADGFTHVAFGDLFLEDVRAYREARLAGTGLTPIFPLWGMPTRDLAHEMIAGGLRARIATLDPRVMPRHLIGAEYDAALLARLPPSVDPCAERGEFHTCAVAGPMFAAPIAVTSGEVVEREGFVYGDLLLQASGDRPAFAAES
jgi:diphthamide synthase (EF-2-diphthine--ammonia ligase)